MWPEAFKREKIAVYTEICGWEPRAAVARPLRGRLAPTGSSLQRLEAPSACQPGLCLQLLRVSSPPAFPWLPLECHGWGCEFRGKQGQVRKPWTSTRVDAECTTYLSRHRGRRRQWQPTPVFCLGNPMDRGAWWAAVHRAVKSWTQLRDQTATTEGRPVGSGWELPWVRSATFSFTKRWKSKNDIYQVKKQTEKKKLRSGTCLLGYRGTPLWFPFYFFEIFGDESMNPFWKVFFSWTLPIRTKKHWILTYRRQFKFFEIGDVRKYLRNKRFFFFF